MKRLLALAPLALILVGCAPTPSTDEVSERFLIELGGAMGADDDALIDKHFGDIARDTAADMIEEDMCGSAAYRTAFEDEGGLEAHLYAFEQTCLMYFEDDMSPAQIEHAKQLLIERATTDG